MDEVTVAKVDLKDDPLVTILQGLIQFEALFGASCALSSYRRFAILHIAHRWGSNEPVKICPRCQPCISLTMNGYCAGKSCN